MDTRTSAEHCDVLPAVALTPPQEPSALPSNSGLLRCDSTSQVTKRHSPEASSRVHLHCCSPTVACCYLVPDRGASLELSSTAWSKAAQKSTKQLAVHCTGVGKRQVTFTSRSFCKTSMLKPSAPPNLVPEPKVLPMLSTFCNTSFKRGDDLICQTRGHSSAMRSSLGQTHTFHCAVKPAYRNVQLQQLSLGGSQRGVL